MTSSYLVVIAHKTESFVFSVVQTKKCVSSPHPVVCFVTTVILAVCQQDMCLRAPSRGSRSLIGGDCSAEPNTSTSSKALPEGEKNMTNLRGIH